MKITREHRKILHALQEGKTGKTAEEVIEAAGLHQNDGTLLLRRLLDAGYVEHGWQGGQLGE